MKYIAVGIKLVTEHDIRRTAAGRFVQRSMYLRVFFHDFSRVRVATPPPTYCAKQFCLYKRMDSPVFNLAQN